MSTRVFHIVSTNKEEFYFNNLFDNVSANDVEFTIINFTPESPFTESLKRQDIKFYTLNLDEKKSSMPIAAYKIWKILEKEKPDIIHTHLLTPSILGLNLAKFKGIKKVLTRHHSDAIHLLPSNLKRKFYLSVERRNNQIANHIIAPSKMVKQCLVDWEKTPEEKVTVIPYGQTSERFDRITPEIIKAKRSELKMNEQLSMVCVSRLFHRKGHEYLFEALAPLVKEGLSAKLYLVGIGDYKDELKNKAEKLNILENIEFLGWRQDVLEIIAAADIIVHPSLEDALSQSLIESLMLERPIIATDISGAGDTLDEGKYGILVPPADAESFKNALIKTVSNLQIAQEKAKRGKLYLLEYMNAKKTAEKHLEIYQKVLS